MKLSIGTVQFGIAYGINNSEGIPSNDAIKEIFSIAHRSGITVLDTAPAYGDAESKIGKLSNNQFKIVSKFSPSESKTEILESLRSSLSRLKISSLYGYLAHNADTLINDPSIWEMLRKEKDRGHISRIGSSVYTCQQLEKLLALNIIPDLIQLPFSLLDRKFEPYFPELKRAGTEIHTRSVFLQGLYFLSEQKLPGKLVPLRYNLNALSDLCKEFKISMGALALNFAVENEFIDCVVIGVDNPSQLQQNISLVNSWKTDKQLTERVNAIHVEHAELLNPSNW